MRETNPDRRCPRCQSQMARSRARGLREDLAYILGSDIVRCASCEGRYLCFLRFNIPTPSYNGHSDGGDSFRIVWFAIFGGILFCLGLALWTLRRFHRWPF